MTRAGRELYAPRRKKPKLKVVAAIPINATLDGSGTLAAALLRLT
jgi:hypothetical protein